MLTAQECMEGAENSDCTRARLAERTRVAEDLHDTLLQGVACASMQLHIAYSHLLAESPAKTLVKRALDLMGRAIEEGRGAIRGLCTFPREDHDLGQALARVPQELLGPTAIDFQVVVEGIARPLRPAIRDEIYLMAREGLVNAFRHSRATEIEATLVYTGRSFQLFIRDNGCGIAPQALISGCHWGLSGMRDRAKRMGAKFKVLSRTGIGTEIRCVVPGRIAFAPQFSDQSSMPKVKECIEGSNRGG